jgi:hypothetical protein
VDVKNRLIELLNASLGQTATLRKSDSQAIYFCPKCNHYKKKLEISIDINQSSFGKYHCWICDLRGKSLDTLFSKLNLNKTYLHQIHELLGIRFSNLIHTFKEPTLSLPLNFKSLFIKNDSIEYKHIIHYLKIRNVGLIDICRYNIGYCNSGEFINFVIIPSYDKFGKLNYFSARNIYDGFIKYRNAESSKDIIGFESFINFSEPITIVEGVFDAIAVRNNAIPLFGTELQNTLKQTLITTRPPKINIMLDNTALNSAIKIADTLLNFNLNVHLIHLPKKDPSEMGFEAVYKMLKSSKKLDFKTLIQYKLIT